MAYSEKVELAGTLKDQAYNLIKDAILEGEFLPGKIISNEELSKWLGISRTPIREALFELQKNHLVIIHRGKGTEVAPFSEKDAAEIFEMREALEIKACELAADRITPEQIAELGTLLTSQRELANNKRKLEFLTIDKQFHSLIAGAACNKRISTAIELLRDQFMLLGNHALSAANRMNEVMEEHQAIYNALSKKDKEEALKAMKLHLKASCPTV